MALATVCRAVSGRQWTSSTQRTNNDREQTEMRLSTWFEVGKSSLMVNPRVLSEVTLRMPGAGDDLALPLSVIKPTSECPSS